MINYLDDQEFEKRNRLLIKVKQELYEQNTHKSYPFFDCVSKLILIKNNQSSALQLFTHVDMNVEIELVNR
ncbi:MAG: hypothetical protein JETCAE03_35860 [Ignavibacteriaceae bacterium]|jgi:hypothetical protein|nr:MAG: hypothetical protein JETCAE03_35860 [Ignavibacteriaceae bacterium]